MTPTPEIDAARDALATAEAAVESLRAKLRAALADQDARGVSAGDRSTDADQPRRLGWADGVAAARARYPKGRGTGDAPGTATHRDSDDVPEADEPRLTSAADGRAEAQRRIAARAA
ncbi:hypothetical protein DQ244_17230 [Blastococcus sp. TBT05-19]|uniref:hypothetical protein n=1 Tax=Blastococcus sp. TBT05-19 TaxID=2250581 RepID=UPI000DEA5F19|nr:hypothetical protein [Blastococcus sp. TBT05-19]RBY87081.1 hypothetical protein DQ244_17230 [Blastococcus sp. TBT05-19]